MPVAKRRTTVLNGVIPVVNAVLQSICVAAYSRWQLSAYKTAYLSNWINSLHNY